MTVLVIADHDGKAVREDTLKTVTAAAKLGAVDILVAGKGVDAAAASAAKVAGVGKVLVADSDALGHGLAEAYEALIVPLAAGYDAIVIPSTSQGKNIAPRIAAGLDVAPITDIIDVVDANTFTRPIYAGNALETVKSSDAKKVITVRPTAFKPADMSGSAKIEKIDAGPGAKGSKFISEEIVKSDRPELGAAKIVVSGGRAMGSAEEFTKVIEPLADVVARFADHHDRPILSRRRLS